MRVAISTRPSGATIVAASAQCRFVDSGHIEKS